MDTTQLEHAGAWRFDQLDGLPDDGRRYEVVDGLLVVSPPPTGWHQLVVGELLVQLARQCPPQWRVLHELGLQLGTDGRVPDLAVLDAAAPLHTPFFAPQHFGLVVEVVSPSSCKTDRFAKPGEYAEAGIPLFWRVETDPRVVLVAYALSAASYEQVAVITDAGQVPTPWGDAHIDLSGLRPGSSS
ncbi:MAG: Uma2 family endonuclease [Mycobacteriales bacterium]